MHQRALERGAWIEYDAIGGRPDELFVDLIKQVFDLGYGHRLLLSQDVVGWRAGAPGGGNVAEGGGARRRYAYLVTDFLPKLRAAGIDEATIRQLTMVNPRRLLALD